jgi:uncharacterized membrane protein
MTWFLIVSLAVVAVIALLLVFVLISLLAAGGVEDDESERARVEMEVRRAEYRLHDIARMSFQDMLAEARAHGLGDRQ